MYSLSIASTLKYELRDLIFENYYKQNGFVKKTFISQLNVSKVFVITCNQINRKNNQSWWC